MCTPERAKLLREQPSHGFSRRGIVKNVLYLGATLEYHLEMEDGGPGLVESHNQGTAALHEAGAAVWFAADDDSCYQLPN